MDTMSAPSPANNQSVRDIQGIDLLGYRVLRRFFPGEPVTMSGAAYCDKSKLRAVLGDATYSRIIATRGTIVDFGCGEGGEAIELAAAGCTVVGVDILFESLATARRAASMAGVGDRCQFTTSPPSEAAAIISQDAFEHFGDPAAILRIMHGMLKPGGTVYASFGPPWYHPLGGHLFSVFPWSHLIFTEAAQIAWRSHIRGDGATRFDEVEGGLNQMTIGKFEQLVRNSSLRLTSLECVPIRKLAPFHCRLTREWTTAAVRATLIRD